MTTTNPGRAGDPTVQVDDDLVEAHARAVFAVENTGPRMHTWDGSSEGVRQSYRDEARLHLTALFAACEVREERRIVIDDERASGLPVNGLWVTPPHMTDTHTSLLGRYPSARMERRFVIETKPEPVVSDNKEATDAP